MSNLFKKLFSKVKERFGNQELIIRDFSQPHALQVYMRYGGIKHGEEVKVDLRGVRIERTTEEGTSPFGKLTMFFCPLQGIKIIEKKSLGDDLPIPGEVTLHNFKVPRNTQPGIYEIKNVLLYANGTINVTCTSETKLEYMHG